MRNLRWIVAAGAMSIALASGCKKDAPPAPPAAPAAPKTEEPKAPEAVKPAEAAPEAAKPAEPAPEAPKPVEPAPTAAVAPAAGGQLGAGLAEAPADVIAVVSVPGVDALWNIVSAKAGKFGVPLPLGKDQILEQAKAAIGLTTIDWLDTSKPAHVIVLNPKTVTGGSLILIPVTDKDKALAALPADKKENDQGNAWSFTIAGKPAYLNVIDGYVTVSPAANAFGLVKDFVGSVAAFSPSGEFDARVAAGNLKTLFGDELASARAQMDSLKSMAKAQLSGNPEAGIPPAIPGLSGLESIVDWAFDFANTMIDETTGLALSFDLDDAGHFSVPMSVRYTADGKIAAFAKAMEGADLSFVSAAPASSYVVIGTEIDPQSMAGMMDFASNMLATVLSLTDEEKAAAKKLMEELLALSGKKTWMSFYPDAKFPLAMVGAAHVTDAKAYQEKYDAYLGMLFTKAMAKLKDQLPPQFQQAPIDSFSKLIETAGSITAPLGVTLTAGYGDVDGINTWKLSIVVDIEKVKAMAGEKGEEVQKLTDALGNKLEIAMAYGTDKVGMAFGPNAAAQAAAAAKGTLVGGTDASKIAKGTACWMQIDAGKAVAAWRPMLEAIGQAADLPTIAEGTTGGFAFGATDGAVTASYFGNLDAIVTAAKDAAMRPAEPGAEAVPVPEGGAAAPAPEGGAAAPAAPTPAPEGGAAAPAPAPEGGGAAAGAAVVPH